MSCWGTLLGPSPSAPLTSGSAHRLLRGHCSVPGGWYRGAGHGTSATGGGEESATGIIRAWDHGTKPLLQTFPVSRTLTSWVGAGLLLQQANSVGEWLLLTWTDRRGRGLIIPLPNKPRATRRGQTASHLVPIGTT